jgi:hypothetical protein
MLGSSPRSVDCLKPDARGESELGAVISFEEIELGDIIGRGSFGVVYSGRCRDVEVAVKTFPETLSEEEVEAIANEVAVM